MITDKIVKFHQDEEGMEAVQVVMIIAIAAMILVATTRLGREVVDWMKQKWFALRGQRIS